MPEPSSVESHLNCSVLYIASVVCMMLLCMIFNVKTKQKKCWSCAHGCFIALKFGQQVRAHYEFKVPSNMAHYFHSNDSRWKEVYVREDVVGFLPKGQPTRAVRTLLLDNTSF